MSNDVTADLIRALIDHMRGASDDWASLAIVVDLDGGRLRGTHGYTYSRNGTISAVASRPSGIRPAVEAYLASSSTPEQDPPVKILVQFDRDSGTYELTYEHVDVARWTPTPANIEQIREELRPGARLIASIEPKDGESS